MSRRSRITLNDRIDRDHRRRTRNAAVWSEAPVPMDVRRLSGAGEGGSWDPGWPPSDWLSPIVTWTDTITGWED